jgi:hypothetical protein
MHEQKPENVKNRRLHTFFLDRIKERPTKKF